MGFLKDFLVGTSGAAAKKNQASASNLLAMGAEAGSFGQMQLMKALTGLDEGFTIAEGILAKQGQAATGQILAGQKQTLGKQTQGLISKGLFNTSVAGNLAQQAQAQTSQQLGSLAEGLGAQQAGLAVQKAGAKAGAYQNLAQFALQKVQLQAGLTPQYTGSSGALPGILGAFGQKLGAGAGSGLASLFSSPGTPAATKSNLDLPD